MSTKEGFIELLWSTQSEGVEDLLEGLENMGFFTAPASYNHHLNTEGGLVRHSLNTCKAALADGMEKNDGSKPLGTWENPSLCHCIYEN